MLNKVLPSLNHLVSTRAIEKQHQLHGNTEQVGSYWNYMQMHTCTWNVMKSIWMISKLSFPLDLRSTNVEVWKVSQSRRPPIDASLNSLKYFFIIINILFTYTSIQFIYISTTIPIYFSISIFFLYPIFLSAHTYTHLKLTIVRQYKKEFIGLKRNL